MRVRIAWATMSAALVGFWAGVFTLSTLGESEPVGRAFEGRSLEEWLTQLESDPESVEVARALHGMGSAALLRIVEELLQGLRAQTAAGGRSMRASQIPPPDFARALSVIGVDHREVLVELLGVRDRGFALAHIRRWMEGSTEAEGLLAEVILDAHLPDERRALGITAFASDQLIPHVPGLLEEPCLRLSLAEYLHRMGPPGWEMYPAILEVLRRSQWLDPIFGRWALAWIAQDGRSRPEVFVPMLLPLTFDVRAPYNFGYSNEDALESGEIPLASQAWGALMNVTQDPAPYEAALRHPDWQVRNASASLYSRQVDLSTHAVRELARCLEDAHPWVRLAAAVALVRVPGYEGAVLSNLLAAIPDQELPAPLRRAAISLAGHSQLQAEKSLQTVRALKVAVVDPDPRVRDAARRLLDRIQGLDGATTPDG